MQNEAGVSSPVDVSVILPVYRCAPFLAELHQRLEATIRAVPASFEIIFVNDASPDDSAEVLSNLEASHQEVHVLTHETNLGQHRAVLTGLANSHGNSAVILDADLQDPPEAIPTLLQSLGGDPNVVFAGRRGFYESPLKLLTSKLFKALLALISPIPADAGIFMALDRKAIDRLLAMNPVRPMIPAMVAVSGLTTTSIPVTRSARSTGTSAYSAWQRLRIGLAAIGWVIMNKSAGYAKFSNPHDTRSKGPQPSGIRKL